MKIFRLSLFNLKKNKREAAAIVFLTLVTAFLMATFAVSITQISSAFDRCFEETGSADFIFLFEDDKYRNIYRDILEEEYNVTDIRESSVLVGMGASIISKKGESTANNIIFADESTERKIENFKKLNALPDDEIEKLSHPIWLPQYFEITAGYAPGDTFTLVFGGRDYPFTIAGFYSTGLYNSSRHMLKCVITDDDMVLLSAVYEEYRLIAFDTEMEFSYEEYYEKCSARSNESVSSIVILFDKDSEKWSETNFLNVFLYMSVFLSVVTLICAVFLILHKISKDMEEQMVQIGVLEALGYTSRELSLSYICEYILTGGIGAIIGGITAAAFSPVMDTLTRGMINRDVHTDVDILRILIVVISIIALVTFFALSRAARVKKLPPVVAFRKGIKTHHFGKNILPLDKMRHSINLRLAFKGIFSDLRSNIGSGICMIAAGVAVMFSVYTFDFFRDGYNGLLGVTGMEIPDISMTMMSGVNGEDFCDEIRKFPEVEKVLLTHAILNKAEIKGSNQNSTVISYSDFSLTDNIHPKTGRFPQYDNEIMISAKREETENRHIGDNIILKGDVCEKSYIITGIVSAMNNDSMSVYMTEDGYRRIRPNDRPNTVEITLKNEEDRAAFMDKLTALYGASAKDTAYEQSAQGSLEERIRAKADEKMAVLISQYGVTDIDYAIRIGDTIISGNSSRFVIKDISSMKDLAKSQMESIAAVTKTFSFWAVIFIAVVVAVILGIIAASAVKRQRRELGIMKSMGYTSRDLMLQLTLRILPVTIISSCIAAVLSVRVQRAFWMAAFGVQIPESLPLMIGTAASLVLYCLIVTYVSAGGIRKISVTELMTE